MKFLWEGDIPRKSVLLNGKKITHQRTILEKGGFPVTPEYRRKPAMLGRVKLDNTLLTCDKGNY